MRTESEVGQHFLVREFISFGAVDDSIENEYVAVRVTVRGNTVYIGWYIARVTCNKTKYMTL